MEGLKLASIPIASIRMNEGQSHLKFAQFALQQIATLIPRESDRLCPTSVHLRDVDGRYLVGVTLIEETLTDNSTVYNVELEFA
jgi:hypothetical protein